MIAFIGLKRLYSLENLLGRSHCALDVESSHILPVLLQQRDEEVNGQSDILVKFFCRHLNMTNAHSKNQYLSHLELDCGFCFFNPSHQGISVDNWGREFSSLVQTRTQNSGDLTDEGF